MGNPNKKKRKDQVLREPENQGEPTKRQRKNSVLREPENQG